MDECFQGNSSILCIYVHVHSMLVHRWCEHTGVRVCRDMPPCIAQHPGWWTFEQIIKCEILNYIETSTEPQYHAWRTPVTMETYQVVHCYITKSADLCRFCNTGLTQIIPYQRCHQTFQLHKVSNLFPLPLPPPPPYKYKCTQYTLTLTLTL